ncbi:MAG: aminopeptidase P family protein [Acidobacteria bacterium]|nr:aminopeptidase P family protein [Acidobacteriota bacterium]
MLRLVVFVLLSTLLPAQPLPSLREQAAVQQEWLRLRLERNLPALMRKHNVAMWLVISREYNEDPVFFSLVSPSTFAARRRTIYVFHDRGPAQGVERLALGGGSQGGLYTVYRDESRELIGDAQWKALRKVVDERNPRSIAIDISHTHAFADGLTAGEREQLVDALGPANKAKLVRAELLALEYVEQRLPEMLPQYKSIMRHAHGLIARAFSNEVITPGRTNSHDVIWWLRQNALAAGFGTWFQPSVRVQKQASDKTLSFMSEDGPVTIDRGDVLHVDFGLSAMRLNTDTQHMGYVLREGETTPPKGLIDALEKGKRMQDHLLARMKPGRSGNAVLAEALADVIDSGIRGTIYSHPIGDHGHGAGPLIGLWDRQQGVPGRGDVPLKPGTWFSIELSARVNVPEWNGQEVFIGMEEEAHMDGDGRMHWVLSRQERFHLVK